MSHFLHAQVTVTDQFLPPDVLMMLTAASLQYMLASHVVLHDRIVHCKKCYMKNWCCCGWIVRSVIIDHSSVLCEYNKSCRSRLTGLSLRVVLGGSGWFWQLHSEVWQQPASLNITSVLIVWSECEEWESHVCSSDHTTSCKSQSERTTPLQLQEAAGSGHWDPAEPRLTGPVSVFPSQHVKLYWSQVYNSRQVLARMWLPCLIVLCFNCYMYCSLVLSHSAFFWCNQTIGSELCRFIL